MESFQSDVQSFLKVMQEVKTTLISIGTPAFEIAVEYEPEAHPLEFHIANAQSLSDNQYSYFASIYGEAQKLLFGE